MNGVGWGGTGVKMSGVINSSIDIFEMIRTERVSGNVLDL